jgi:DNA-binding MarR family transcriptional regulator
MVGLTDWDGSTRRLAPPCDSWTVQPHPTVKRKEGLVSGFVLDTFLPYQLAVAAERVSRDFARLYRERFGIGIPEWRVIAHLSQAGSVSVREIHLRAGMDKSRVSRAAARLEEAGYILKQEHPGDRRLVELSLTPKGRNLISEMAPVARDYEARVMAELGLQAEPFRIALGKLVPKD